MSVKILPLFTAMLLTLLLATPAVAPRAAAADDDELHAEGTWQGVLESGALHLRVVVHIRRGSGGELAGTLDSIDQGARGLPLDAIKLVEDVLSFQLTQLGARYAGNFYGDDTIRGVWSQGENSLPLILKRADVSAALQAQGASVADERR